MGIDTLTASDISAYESYLAHHGIKGQKWGVRRFQNEDGSLTEKGLKRQARQFTRELNRNDKKLAVSRAHSLRIGRKLEKKEDKIERLNQKGKTHKAQKLELKTAKLYQKKDVWDAKTASISDRQISIANACKKLNLDISKKSTMRSTRTRGEKIGAALMTLTSAFVIAVVGGGHGSEAHGIVSTTSKINGTKYKVRLNTKRPGKSVIADYSSNQRLETEQRSTTRRRPKTRVEVYHGDVSD